MAEFVYASPRDATGTAVNLYRDDERFFCILRSANGEQHDRFTLADNLRFVAAFREYLGTLGGAGEEFDSPGKYAEIVHSVRWDDYGAAVATFVAGELVSLTPQAGQRSKTTL
jgi:hypothetical protein